MDKQQVIFKLQIPTTEFLIASIKLPYIIIISTCTNYAPVVTRIALSLLPVAADLLVAAHRTREMVRVQVLPRRQVFQAYHAATTYRLSPRTNLARGRLHHPVAVDVFLYFGARHRLLSTARSIFDIVRV